jgi:RNA polymerase sigma-70 factor, ECF subfamily
MPSQVVGQFAAVASEDQQLGNFALRPPGRAAGGAPRHHGQVDLEPYRGELVAYCYRMLGSVQDAEDLVQETMLRAWRGRDRYDAARASVRTWLYRIATNACMTALEGRARRPLPSGLGAPSQDTQAPLRPADDIPWLQPFPDARFDVGVRADLRLAVLVALQMLPPRQRAVLVLRDVLDFSAPEVAGQLSTTVAAVNSSLQRARAALADVGDPGAVSEAGDPRVRAVVDQYVRAFEAADVPGLVRLLAADAVLEMPPVPLWYRGADHYEAFMHRVFEMRGPGWQVRLVSANGQPALAGYVPAGDHLAYHSLQLLTVADDQVTRNVVFADPRLAADFGLPASMPPRNPGRPR